MKRSLRPRRGMAFHQDERAYRRRRRGGAPASIECLFSIPPCHEGGNGPCLHGFVEPLTGGQRHVVPHHVVRTGRGVRVVAAQGDI